MRLLIPLLALATLSLMRNFGVRRHLLTLAKPQLTLVGRSSNPVGGAAATSQRARDTRPNSVSINTGSVKKY